MAQQSGLGANDADYIQPKERSGLVKQALDKKSFPPQLCSSNNSTTFSTLSSYFAESNPDVMVHLPFVSCKKDWAV
ncbi:hypothetical protein L917_05648 [Phytophthora nicotianae]|uniref:Uncharacterized protein n=1 Tax=Phytophthora nicotianae TaxID=4792 RepID=W2LHQ2_PHYNI|nr:hypothetical protein L917_05648 [Phytophthora nicotianae]